MYCTPISLSVIILLIAFPSPSFSWTTGRDFEGRKDTDLIYYFYSTFNVARRMDMITSIDSYFETYYYHNNYYCFYLYPCF